MVHAVRIHTTGGPEVLMWEAVEVGAPGPGEVRVAQRAIGLNFIDVYHRSGLYKLAALPAIIGMEGAGDVVAVGPEVSRSQGRRPRGLCGCARRLCRGAPHRRRPAGEASGCHLLRDRRGDRCCGA